MTLGPEILTELMARKKNEKLTDSLDVLSGILIDSIPPFHREFLNEITSGT